jgi:hypothetical protein
MLPGIFGVVGELDGFREGVDFVNRDDRAEDLLAGMPAFVAVELDDRENGAGLTSKTRLLRSETQAFPDLYRPVTARRCL